ncbi:MAG: NFACT family protein [Treponema sp.]|nr:NFACT family protein [Treponema sp.]
MSLNWKEINLILEELELPGMQIQKAIQSAFDVLCLKLYGRGRTTVLLISISPGACRVHETFDSAPKTSKPLRFAEFLNPRIVNSRIEEAVQLGTDRIIRLTVRCSHYPEEERCRIYIRLWSNAANVIVTDSDGKVLDAMKRLPKKGEVSGGRYAPEDPAGSGESPGTAPAKPGKEYCIREFPEDVLDGLPADASFNQKIDAFYRKEGGALSLDALQEEARRTYEGSIGRIKASLERLREKEADFAGAGRLREYGDLILANLGMIKPGDEWLETESYLSGNSPAGDPSGGSTNGGAAAAVKIKLDPKKSPAASAQDYYEQYRKAKSGLSEIRIEIEEGEKELLRLEETLQSLLAETNPLVLHKLLKSGGSGLGEKQSPQARREDSKRPGLSFRRGDWLIIVGRDATENDALLRKHVKGGDLWLHARDYPGSYVFIKQRSGKTVPLDILLDAGHLALFYSKGRNSGEGDLFYTPVKYLRRAKDGPKGLVIPTQEKNLHVKVDPARLRYLESCKV